MYKYFNIIYNYINLLTNLFYVFYYSIDINEDIKLLNNIKNNIDNIGGIGIKCVQWFMPYYKLLNPCNNVTKKFNIYFDDCNYHSIEHTEYIYKRNFNKSIYDKYNIIKLLGSGSIGQVYLIENKITKKKYALKVLHPDINIQVYIFKIFYIIFKLFVNINKYIPIKNIDLLVDDLTNQLNLENEYNYNNLFHKLYSDNDYIIIPKIYKHTKNILIMDYIEGIKYDINNDKIINNKNNIIQLLSVFIENNSLNNIMHGDLHEGNWCIDLNDNDKIKLIIYDYGFCYNISDNEFNILLDFFTSPDKVNKSENLIKYYLNKNINNHIDQNKINNLVKNFKKSKNFQNTVVDKIEDMEDINLIYLISSLINYLIDNNIYISHSLLNGFIIFLQLIGYYGNDRKSVGISGWKSYNLSIINTLNEYNICNSLKKKKLNLLNECSSSFDNDFKKFQNLKKFI